MAYTAEIIAVGTELLLGNIANTDAQMISEGLAELGINVFYHTVVGDNAERLTKAVEIARSRADIIITTGGLGPTYDDMTKQTVCRCFGRELCFHPDILEDIRLFFETQLHKPMPECNRQQAMLPVDCVVFDNPRGTAPGCAFEEKGQHVLMLPGPPTECSYMFKNRAMPYLRALSPDTLVSHSLRIFGIGESHLQELLKTQIETYENPTVAPYAKTGECMLRVTAKAASREEAEALCRPVVDEICALLGDAVYGIDVENLESVCLSLLQEKGKVFATAESCTGGLVAKRITDLPGASGVFCGGVVSYTNEVKVGCLGVPWPLLDKHSAVSRPVAEAMAKGVRRICGCDMGVAVTGLAGPKGDEFGNPVGRVFVALATPEGVFCRELSLGKRRERVRNAAANHAFDMIRRYLSGLEIEHV